MKRATFTSLATGLLFAVATAIGLAQSQPRATLDAIVAAAPGSASILEATPVNSHAAIALIAGSQRGHSPVLRHVPQRQAQRRRDGFVFADV